MPSDICPVYEQHRRHLIAREREEFHQFMLDHPALRFWQAVIVWSGYDLTLWNGSNAFGKERAKKNEQNG